LSLKDRLKLICLSRSSALALLLFKVYFGGGGGSVALALRLACVILKACPAKGLGRNGAFVLASVWMYQVCFLTDYRESKPATHVKDHVDYARWRIKT
jgi:hypothetical protein